MKTYVLCSSLDSHSLETLKRVKNVLDLTNVKVHIITIVEIKYYNLEFIPYIYPSEGQYYEIEGNANRLLQSVANELNISEKNLVINTFFDSSKEDRVKSYLVDVEADMVVTATRGKHGIKGYFSSSFTDFLCKFSPCDVLVMREELLDK